MRKIRIYLAAMVWAGILCMGAGVQAGITDIDGTRFDNTIKVEESRLALSGAAMLKYLGFIEAYAGALYLPLGANGVQALEDIAKYLVLEYRVAIDAPDFAKATRKKIKDGVSPSAFDRLLPQIEALNRLYKSVDPGDRYALAYVPGLGTRLLLNDTPLGTVQGAEFAAALFGIWIGKNPINKKFRNRLLGKEK